MSHGGVQRGYLVLGDISGYTAFLTGTELEHANGIIEDLTGCVVENLQPALRLVKLEGDAVFAYAHDSAFAAADRVLEVIEQCYVAFQDRVFDLQRQSTCSCAACASVGVLGLKFVAHFGEFIVQHRPAVEDLVGSDVIIVHRLLKNQITARLGVAAYAFLTDALVARMVSRPHLPEHSETYDAIGTVRGLVEDLAPVADAQRRHRRIVVTAEDADIDVEIHLPVTRPLAWDWLTAPERLVQFESGLTGARLRPNDEGRVGIGSEMHCAHGSGRAVRRILDWKPFDYFTEDLERVEKSFTTPLSARATMEFVDRSDGTTVVRYRVRLDKPNLALRVFKPAVRRTYRRTFEETERRFRTLVARGEIDDAGDPTPVSTAG